MLFHLIEKNKVNIYDIPINDITDQYMEYMFAMQELDLEIASEFLVMAASLLHIKSKMLLPDKKVKDEEETDPREELVLKLVQYKKYKEFSKTLKQREETYAKVFYKLPEAMEFEPERELLSLSPFELVKVYKDMLEKNRKKINDTSGKMTQIMQHEKVSIRSKIREVMRTLIDRAFFSFSELFCVRVKSRTEVVTGFLAILELSKLKKVHLEQKKQFSDIIIRRSPESF